jgi:uncharacterized membrane protein YfcA
MSWQLILVGLGLGLVVGLTGVGGGSLMTPILIIFFGFPAKVAIGTDIFHSAIFKSFGAWRHRSLGTVHGHLALWLFAGSGPLAVVGVWLSWYLQDSLTNAESVLKVILGGTLILGGLGFLAKSFITRGPETSDGPFLMSQRDKVIALMTGAVFGFVVGLTSVGSGTFFGLVMVLVYPLTMSKIVGTDIFHAAALLWVAGIGHAFIGDIDWHAVGWLLIGSIPGILISSRWTVRVPQLTIRLGLGGILVISGINLVDVNKHLPNAVFVSLLSTLTVVVGGYTLMAMRDSRAARGQA